MIKTTRLTRTAALLAVGAAFAVPAVASARDRQADHAIVGGLLGALAGGLIGGDATGALVGAGAGAFLGAATTHGGRDYGRYGYESRYDGYRGGGYGYRPSYDYGRQTNYGGYGQAYRGYDRAYPVDYGYGYNGR